MAEGRITSNTPRISGQLQGTQRISGQIQGGSPTVSGSLDKSTRAKDYNTLVNKPQIEGVILEGNKTFEDLTLVSLSNTEIEDLLTL